jgi:hypothetical protein
MVDGWYEAYEQEPQPTTAGNGQEYSRQYNNILEMLLWRYLPSSSYGCRRRFFL